MIRGDNRTYTLRFNNGVGPIDISGWKVEFIIKKSVGALDSTLKKEITIHTDPEQGITIIPFLPEDTGAMAKGKYFYLIRVTTDKSEIFTVLYGILKVMGF